MNKISTEEERRQAQAIDNALVRFTRITGNRSPLVATLEGPLKISQYPACVTCPAGLWFYDEDLRCFCKVMKKDVYGPGVRPVRACAERELVLSENLQAAREGR